MPLSEKEELELLELEKEQALAFQQSEVKDAVAGGPAEAPGMAERLWEGANAPLPGVGGVVDAIREGIPGFIAEKTGALAERAGPFLGPDIQKAGIAAAGTIGMAGELLPRSALDVAMLAAGGPLGRGAAKLGAKMLPALESRAPNVVKAVKSAMAANITPTMTQILQSKPMAQAEEVMARLPFFGSRITAMREAQEKAYQALRGKAISEAGPKVAGSELGATAQGQISSQLEAQTAERETALAKLHGRFLKKSGDQVSREQVGRELDNIITQKVEASRKVKNKLYEMVAEEIPPEADSVLARGLQTEAAKVLESVRNLPGEALEGSTKKLLTELADGPAGKVVENAVDPIMKITIGADAGDIAWSQAIGSRGAYTFKEMSTLREILNAKINQRVISGNKKEAAILHGLKNSLDKDIEAFSASLPADIKKKFDVATTYYRDFHKGRYASKEVMEIADMARKDPENVYGMIVKPGDVSDIRRLKSAIGEPGMAPLRRRFLDEITTGEGGKVLSGPEIIQNISKYGEPTLKELLSSEQYADLARFAQTRQMPRFVESMMEKKLRGLIQKSGNMYRASEEVVAQIVNGDVATLRAVKRIVGPDGTKPYRRRVIEDILGEMQNPEALPGQIQQKTSFGVHRALKSYDENFLAELFSKKELAEIEQIDNIRALLESQPRLTQNAPNTAAATIAPMISGGVITLGLFHPLKAGAVAITADVLSRLYTSDAGRQLLIKGLDPKLANNMPLYGKILAAVANAKRDKSDEDRFNSGIKTK